jgi:hypothetical protein
MRPTAVSGPSASRRKTLPANDYKESIRGQSPAAAMSLTDIGLSPPGLLDVAGPLH